MMMQAAHPSQPIRPTSAVRLVPSRLYGLADDETNSNSVNLCMTLRLACARLTALEQEDYHGVHVVTCRAAAVDCLRRGAMHQCAVSALGTPARRSERAMAIDPPPASPQARLPAVPSGSPMRSQPLWRNRDFTILWSGQAVSTLGSSIPQIALPLLVLALTHSPAQAGLLGALQFVPYLLLSLPAGVLLDRWNRKTVMLLCDAGRALALGSLPLVVLVVGQPLTLLHIYLVAVTDGTFFVFFNLAESSALPHVVPAPQVATATAQNHVREATSVLVGPPLGTLLFTLGQTVPFLVDALSYLASVISLAFIRTRFQVRRSAHRGHDGAKPHHLGAELREGVAFLTHHRLLRTLAFLTAGLSLSAPASRSS
jgi:Transmembrane secretion effector